MIRVLPATAPVRFGSGGGSRPEDCSGPLQRPSMDGAEVTREQSSRVARVSQNLGGAAWPSCPTARPLMPNCTPIDAAPSNHLQCHQVTGLYVYDRYNKLGPLLAPMAASKVPNVAAGACADSAGSWCHGLAGRCLSRL